jgi:hypothetical protein
MCSLSVLSRTHALAQIFLTEQGRFSIMSESLVGLAFGAAFGIVAFLISKTGGAQKAASLCGPIKNPKSG